MSLLLQLTGRFLKGLKPSPISKDDAKIVDCSVFFVCGITVELARVLLWKYPMLPRIDKTAGRGKKGA